MIAPKVDVFIGGVSMFTAYNMLLQSASLERGFPNPKTVKVDVPGRDGELDFTEFFGGVNYENAAMKLPLDYVVGSFQESEILNWIHGKTHKISFSDDPGFFYVGRCTITEMSKQTGVGHLEISVDRDPWKYKSEETVISQTVDGSGVVQLPNLRRPTVPAVTTTAEMTIAWDGHSVTLPAGTQTVDILLLPAGVTDVTVTGTGTITFVYREAGL